MVRLMLLLLMMMMAKRRSTSRLKQKSIGRTFSAQFYYYFIGKELKAIAKSTEEEEEVDNL